jgi:hypothetical protein
MGKWQKEGENFRVVHQASAFKAHGKTVYLKEICGYLVIFSIGYKVLEDYI